VGRLAVPVQLEYALRQHAHGHDTNPNFQHVILHVVWDEPPSSQTAAQGPAVRIALKQVLDAPPAELALALESESGFKWVKGSGSRRMPYFFTTTDSQCSVVGRLEGTRGNLALL
jgi:hypothetical protein